MALLNLAEKENLNLDSVAADILEVCSVDMQVLISKFD